MEEKRIFYRNYPTVKFAKNETVLLEDEIPKYATHQFFTDLLHPDDYPCVMEAMGAHLQGKTSVYEVEYQIKTKNGGYKRYYDLGKITKFCSFHEVFTYNIFTLVQFL